MGIVSLCSSFSRLDGGGGRVKMNGLEQDRTRGWGLKQSMW